MHDELNNLHKRHRAELAARQAVAEEIHRPARPKKDELWERKGHAELFKVKSVTEAASGVVTVFVISPPLTRMWRGPLDQFLEKFERIKDA